MGNLAEESLPFNSWTSLKSLRMIQPQCITKSLMGGGRVCVYNYILPAAIPDKLAVLHCKSTSRCPVRPMDGTAETSLSRLGSKLDFDLMNANLCKKCWWYQFLADRTSYHEEIVKVNNDLSSILTDWAKRPKIPQHGGAGNSIGP